MNIIIRGFIVFAGILLASCATNIKPSRSFNPPPQEIFSTFNRFELRPVVLSPQYSEHSANQRAARKIQEYFDTRVKPIVDVWSKEGNPGNRTLVIEPYIEEIKFIGGGARFFVGPLAGSSAVILKVKYIDRDTGKIVAEPEFYQKASAMSSVYGGEDNAMLDKVVSLVVEYTSRNYGARIGGNNGLSENAGS